MPIAFLVDTNVLVYPYDTSDPFKRQRAAQVLAGLGASGLGALSAQILGEFYVVATRRIPSPLSPAEAERSITNYLRSWTVYDVSSWTVLEAARACQHYQLSYWDALVWATAKLNQVSTVLSEDFSDGQLLEGVRFTNPFAPAFDIATLAR